MERPIVRLETVRRYAPVEREELAAEIGGFLCGQETECRYRHQHTDIHHLAYPKSDYTDELGMAFRNHPDNQVAVCRCSHDSIHKTWTHSERPDDDYIVGWLIGTGGLNKRTREAIKQHRKGRGNAHRLARPT